MNKTKNLVNTAKVKDSSTLKNQINTNRNVYWLVDSATTYLHFKNSRVHTQSLVDRGANSGVDRENTCV